MAEMGLSVGMCVSSVLLVKETIMPGSADTAVHKTAARPSAKSRVGWRLRETPQSVFPWIKKKARVKISIKTSYRFSEIFDMPVKLIKVDINRTIHDRINTRQRGYRGSRFIRWATPNQQNTPPAARIISRRSSVIHVGTEGMEIPFKKGSIKCEMPAKSAAQPRIGEGVGWVRMASGLAKSAMPQVSAINNMVMTDRALPSPSLPLTKKPLLGSVKKTNCRQRSTTEETIAAAEKIKSFAYFNCNTPT